MANSRPEKEDVRQLTVINAGLGVGFTDIMVYRGLGIDSEKHIAHSIMKKYGGESH